MTEFLEKISAIVEQFERDPEEMTERCKNKAVWSAHEHILNGRKEAIELIIEESAKAGKRAAQIFSWSTDDVPMYGTYSLLTLLSKFHLLNEMQDWLDLTYPPTEEIKFRIFFHHVKNSQGRWAITISWDQSPDAISKLENIINNNKHRHDVDDASSQGDGGSHHGGGGHGGYRGAYRGGETRGGGGYRDGETRGGGGYRGGGSYRGGRGGGTYNGDNNRRYDDNSRGGGRGGRGGRGGGRGGGSHTLPPNSLNDEMWGGDSTQTPTPTQTQTQTPSTTLTQRPRRYGIN
jgi:hypothetical protein